jgi:hypothetical protein
LPKQSRNFSHHFERCGDFVDIQKAICAHEKTLHLAPDGHPEKPASLNNLGTSFARHFRALGTWKILTRQHLRLNKLCGSLPKAMLPNLIVHAISAPPSPVASNAL